MQPASFHTRCLGSYRDTRNSPGHETELDELARAGRKAPAPHFPESRVRCAHKRRYRKAACRVSAFHSSRAFSSASPLKSATPALRAARFNVSARGDECCKRADRLVVIAWLGNSRIGRRCLARGTGLSATIHVRRKRRLPNQRIVKFRFHAECSPAFDNLPGPSLHGNRKQPNRGISGPKRENRLLNCKFPQRAEHRELIA